MHEKGHSPHVARTLLWNVGVNEAVAVDHVAGPLLLPAPGLHVQRAEPLGAPGGLVPVEPLVEVLACHTRNGGQLARHAVLLIRLLEGLRHEGLGVQHVAGS